MTTMKITLDAAMRARDVSPPAPVDDGMVGDDAVNENTVADGNSAGADVAQMATRDGAQP
jgi:hypothetical protein